MSKPSKHVAKNNKNGTHFRMIACEKPAPRPSPKGSYTRIFPEADKPLDNLDGERRLQLLAARMTAPHERRDATSLVPGYTYFGQFIDHDLTWNKEVAFDAEYAEQTQASNFRTSYLDLDSVYGDGPPLNCQYEGPKDGESFIIWPTTASPALGLPGGVPRDVPFEDNKPVIGDRVDLRNAENLIVRQLHVVFMMFHNEVIKQLPTYDGQEGLPTEGTLFERSRRLVTWTYQYLVWNDFLRKIRPGRSRKPRRSNEVQAMYCLPLEFILAGFRFGHSLVQDAYALNCHHNFVDHTAVPLSHLMNRSEDSAPRLAEEFAIEWGHFFGGIRNSSGVPPIKTSQIDTHITPILGDLSGGTVRMFSPAGKGPERLNLAYLTLLRGAKAHQASGQQAADFLCRNGIEIPPITDKLNEDSALQAAGLTDNTPLWFYILKEAEVNRKHGDSLGDLGLYIVEKALEGALQHDPNSYLNMCGADWTPPRWILPENRPDMTSLIVFAGATKPVQNCH